MNNNTRNCSEVVEFLNYLFKSKTTEMCEYLNELNVIPFLLSCFSQQIVVEGDEQKTNSILVGVSEKLNW